MSAIIIHWDHFLKIAGRKKEKLKEPGIDFLGSLICLCILRCFGKVRISFYIALAGENAIPHCFGRGVVILPLELLLPELLPEQALEPLP